LSQTPNFNTQQIEVIMHNEGPCVAVAVAGAGKTTSVVHRIERLIKQERAKASEILATTFTKKAATEMNERLKSLWIDPADMEVSTFHSICYGILREEVGNLDVDASGNKTKALLKMVLGYQNLNWNVPYDDISKFITDCKNDLQTPADIEPEDIRYKQAYELFELKRKQQGFMTFDDMLVETYKLFMDVPEILERWQERIKYVIVDEFQDTNTAQYELMKLLAYPENNIMVVGDDDQSIYSWRGAVPDYMINFQNEFGGKIVRMETNYRCPKIISHIANPLIKNNTKRLDKTLITHRDDMGIVEVIESLDFNEEAENVLNYIKKLPTFEVNNLKQIAVLYRTNAQSRALEETFSEENIPYELVGGFSFYDRKEIKDLLFYLTAAYDIDMQGDETFLKIINVPFRFLGKAFFDGLKSYQQKMKVGVEEALREMSMTKQQQKQIDGLLEIIDQLRYKQGKNPHDLLNYVIGKIDYINYLKRHEGEGDSENNRVSNIKELVRSAERFKTAEKFIQHIEHIKNKKPEPGIKNKITLSSIHRAKGLEWDDVIVIGCNDLILPHGNSLFDEVQIEEERRLAYVAVTRPKERLALSYARQASAIDDSKFLIPSKFLFEMNIL
jgi:DNA helicase II / ATP-dependent DNA helicase PcrA